MMRRYTWRAAIASIGALALSLALTQARAAPPRAQHQFAAIGHVLTIDADDTVLRQVLQDNDDASLAFVVITGVKGTREACSDALYQRRRELLDNSLRPLIVSLAASDWSECKHPNGRSAAVDRLNRVRELMFGEPSSLGEHKLALTRLSATAKFRSYAENAHWDVDKVLYATINLPSDNNHYRREAGRNNEFEDRQVANRAWLHRLLTLAQRKKSDAIVLFSEADIGMLAAQPGKSALAAGFSAAQDGFADLRHQIALLSKKFPGKVLLIDADQPSAQGEAAIAWRGNLGHLSLGTRAQQVLVTPGAAHLFTLKKKAADNPG